MKVLKIIGCGVLLIALIAGAAIVLIARMYMTPEHVMRSLQAALALHMQARITCSAVDVRPLSGITLRDVQIYDMLSAEGEPQLLCAEVHLTHSLLPLLMKRLLIRDIAVFDPVYMPLTRTLRHGYAGMTDVRPPLQVLVLPRSLRVSGGRVQLKTENGPLGLEDIDLDVRRISFITETPIALTARITGDRQADVSGTGTLSITGRLLRLELACNQVSLARFSQHLQAAGVPLTSGLVSAQAIIASGLDQARLQVRLQLSDGTLRLPAAPMDEPGNVLKMQALHASTEINAVWDMNKRTCELNEITGNLLSAPFRGSASIRDTGKGAYVRGRLRLPELELEKIFAHCAQLPAVIPTDLRLDGPLGVRVNISAGPDKDIVPEFLFSLRDNSVLYPGLGSLQPRLSGTFSMDATRISIDRLKIGTDNLWIALAGDVRDYRAQAPQTNLRIDSSYINFVDLFALDENADAELIGPLDLGPLSLQGPINIGTTYFFGMKLNDVRGDYQLKHNVFEIKDLAGTIENGRFTSGLSLDLGVRGLAYDAHLDIDGIELSEALRLFVFELQQYVSGALSGTCRFAGTGSDTLSFLRNLTARADLRIADASVRLLELFPQLSSVIESRALERVNFEAADLQLQLDNTIVRMSGAFLNPDIKMYPEGTIGLDGSLDLVVQLYLAPEIFSDRGELSRYLPREQGMVALQIVVQGTFGDPQIALSRDTLNVIIQKALPQLMKEMLKGADGGAASTPE